MSMGKTKLIWFTLAGMLVGYILVHPFAMLANMLGPRMPNFPMEFSFWGHHLRVSFSPEMLVMGGAFAFMGGFAGFCLGAWYLQKEHWMAEKLESQKRLVALETLRDLMVTLAHYIRNSNMVIGGFSAHLLRNISDEQSAHKLQMILQASREIEGVINALQNLAEISTVKYTTEGQARMIDLKKELEAILNTDRTIKEDYES